MDLPCASWQDHVAQKWITLDSELREHFVSLNVIDDVFKFVLTVTAQQDVDFMQCLSSEYSIQKDTEQAIKYRQRGNTSFKSGNYTAAALHYSQGICFAPPKSEQLSLCYANRSAALYHLQYYQQSLDDIDQALRTGYPSHLLHKLQSRRRQCLSHQTPNLDQDHSTTKCHKSPSSMKTTSVSHSAFGVCPRASIKFNLEQGRHLVATEKIAAGEVILHDRPYGCVLIPGIAEVKGNEMRCDKEKGVFGTQHRHCHRCLIETLCPVPCEGCGYSCYCSTLCRKEAWDEHHCWECPLGADLIVMGVMAHLALRVTLKAGLKNIQKSRELIRDGDSSGQSDDCSDSSQRQRKKIEPSALQFGDSYLSVCRLLHHFNRHSPSLRFLYAVTIATLYRKLSKASPPPASCRQSESSQSQGPDEEGGVSGWSPDLWPVGSTVLKHLLQLRCNAQAVLTVQHTGATDSSVQSSREVRIATAIFPTLSLLNHSCCPNTSLVFSTGTSPGSWGPELSADFSESGAEDSRSTCGVTVTVRAARVISPGQEILHCYGPHSSRMEFWERRRLLEEQYYFLCTCEACVMQEQQQEEVVEDGTDDSGILCGKCKGPLKKSNKDRGTEFICPQSCSLRMSYAEVYHRLQEIRADLQTAVELMEQERPDEAMRILKKTQSQTGLILAETHPLQGELSDAMARAYATVGDWNNAASQLERSAVAICSQYGEDSIELGRQLFKLAQLHFNGGARSQALSVIPKAKRLLCLHCGPHCLEFHELQAMEDCLQG
ncbi:SET and MYND domain-containing protein 4 [Thalassophryne amazonica]|uniref:SET and MYND domain-containing protein 4 n=1 Tax=Thalassophryne amazonica TaxID=390379 RepID=UPI001470DF9C|nr:SET and MYND domain-containing protein 4 [Thalassophryne amazonica]